MTKRPEWCAEAAWRSFEISLGPSPAADPYPSRRSPIELVLELLDRQLNSGAFAYALVIDRPFGPIGRLISTPVAEWPRVVVNTDAARRGASVLAQHGAQGFELVIGSSSSHEDLRDFFIERGYRQTADALYGSGKPGDIGAAAPHDDRFAQALAVAMTLPARTLCVFAHDVDPVYVLSSQ